LAPAVAANAVVAAVASSDALHNATSTRIIDIPPKKRFG
jgi:hypothetical protein